MRKYKLFDKEKILNRVKRLDEQEGFFQSKIGKIMMKRGRFLKKYGIISEYLKSKILVFKFNSEKNF